MKCALLPLDRAMQLDFSTALEMTGRESRPTAFFHFYRPPFLPFCHFDQSVVFSLALAQNRGFCAKEERQRSEVARRVNAACLERSLARRARGEISERQRRTKDNRPRKKTRPYILCKGALPLFHFTSAKKLPSLLAYGESAAGY